MTMAAKLCRHAAIAALALICFNLAAYSVVVAVEVSCSGNSCVEFYQWRYAGEGGMFHTRECVGAEPWGYLDACCLPSVDPDLCTDYKHLLDFGESTRKVMNNAFRHCTSTSCPDEKVQVFTATVFVEFVSATRYRCFGANEE